MVPVNLHDSVKSEAAKNAVLDEVRESGILKEPLESGGMDGKGLLPSLSHHALLCLAVCHTAIPFLSNLSIRSAPDVTRDCHSCLLLARPVSGLGHSSALSTRLRLPSARVLWCVLLPRSKFWMILS